MRLLSRLLWAPGSSTVDESRTQILQTWTSVPHVDWEARVQIICRICEAVYDDEMAQQRRSHKAVHHKAISAQNRRRHAGPCDLPINSIDRRELKLRSMRLPAVRRSMRCGACFHNRLGNL